MEVKEKVKFPKYIWVLLTLIILNIAFIWVHSMMPKADSLEESNFFSELIRPIVEFLFGDDRSLVWITRKGGHFIEFFALGFLTSLFLILKARFIKAAKFCAKDIWIYAASSAVFGLVVGAIDEVIQIFSARGPLVTDALIDFLAASIASLIISIVFLHFVQRNS